MSEHRSPAWKRRRKSCKPSKLTPRKKQRILAAIQAGAPARTACIGSGIAESTFYDWFQRARDPDAPKEYLEFARELEQAREAGQIARIAHIMKAGERDWRAHAWLAERIDPENFSARYQIEHYGRVTVESPLNAFAAPTHTADVIEDRPLTLPEPDGLNDEEE